MQILRRAVPTAVLLAVVGALWSAPASAAPQGSVTGHRAGGYYTGTTTQGRDFTLDVTPSGRRVAAVQWEFDCAGQRAQAALQSIRIRRRTTPHRFSASRDEQALLFLDTYLSEMAHVETSGRFRRRGRKVSGTFRVTSPTCGDTGPVGYSGKLDLGY
jgi:hypothetical protein